MPRTSPAEFVRQVKQEASKVTWPTKKETMITTAMVFVMIFLAALFFFLVDKGLGSIISAILGFGA